MARIESLAKAGYYPTPPKTLELLRSRISAHSYYYRKKDVFRLLDPCCGAGDALKSIAEKLESDQRSRRQHPIETYGVEVQSERAGQAQQLLDEVLETDFFRTSIGHGQFGLIFLNPPYDTEGYSPDGRKRTELAYLQRCTFYLAVYGVLVYIIPQSILGQVSQHLSSYFQDIQCVPFHQEERERFNQIAVLAKKKANAFPDAAMERKISGWAYLPQEETEPPPDLRSTYLVPSSVQSAVLFINLELNLAGAVEEAAGQGLLNNQVIRRSFWPERQENTRPLLPLRKGHLAQLIAAGFTDNVELQHEGEILLVKGRIDKVWEETENTPTRTVSSEKLTASVVTLNLNTGKLERIRT